MILDDQGIARVSRWSTAEESGNPDWSLVAEKLGQLGLSSQNIRGKLAEFTPTVSNLPHIMEEEGVDEPLIDQLKKRIKEVVKNLEKIKV
jgi:hypothetical protein